MHQVCLCFEKDSTAIQFVQNFRTKTKKEDLSENIREGAIDLKDMLNDSNFIKSMHTTVDVQCQLLRQRCESLIDQFASSQKIYITSELVPQHCECDKIVKAVLENDVQLFDANKTPHQILSEIDLIFDQQKSKATKIDQEVKEQNQYVSQRLQDIFNLDLYLNRKFKEQQAQKQPAPTKQTMKLQIEQLEADLKSSKEDAKLKYDELCSRYQSQSKYTLDDQLQLVQKKDHKFAWSTIYKHPNVQIVKKTLINTVQVSFNCVILDPLMSHKSVSKVQVNLSKSAGEIMLHICDLKMIKYIFPPYQDIYKSQGQVSHYSHGDTWVDGVEEAGAFTFSKGDTVEMQWDGPRKLFTTLKLSTGQKQKFFVDFDEDAEIHFGVSLYLKDAEVKIVDK